MSPARETVVPRDAGAWDTAALALLPSGGYTWHHFPGRGYRALVGTTALASVVPVRPRGWCLAIAGFTWHGTQAGLPVPIDGSGGMRWFTSSRRAMATAGELLAAGPLPRREQPPLPPPVVAETTGATQAAFAF